ncbi:MAG: 16S rRNA processing protein RimM [Erysipelotrichaceae bacterium]|nr:16S rRNA processing protein RimM [Erysipelotrichaceae bacterium]
MTKNDYIEIGKVVNTFGIKGELKIVSESDFVDYRYAVGKTIFLKLRNTIKEVRVSSYRVHKGNILITIDKIYDINEVEKYIGADVLADKLDVPPLEDGEFYIDDVVGLDVYNETGEKIGKVVDVILIPANDLIEIELLNGKKELIPYVDEYILEITEDKIVVRLLEVDHD